MVFKREPFLLEGLGWRALLPHLWVLELGLGRKREQCADAVLGKARGADHDGLPR